jgi:hypothetical protein
LLPEKKLGKEPGKTVREELIQALRGQGLSEKWAHTDPFG